MEKIKVGLVGCGVIADSAYLPAIAKMDKADLVAVCDVVEERARAAGQKFNVPQSYTDLDEMLAQSGVELLVNTTPIQTHFEVNLKALQAGKHVYSEKTMAGSVEEATILIEEAQKRGLKLGAAAATMLSSTNQKIKQLIADGAIGKVAFIKSRDSHGGPAYFPYWPLDPTWFYKPGAGPLPDMGVYGLHTVTGLLGPAKRVTSLAGISDPVRYVRGGPYKGKRIEVEVEDNILILLDFDNATFAFVDATFCVRAARGPVMEIYGSDGTISVSSEEEGGPPLALYRDEVKLGVRGWTTPELPRGEDWFTGAVAHMIDCILEDKPPIVSAEHARHVIEIMAKCIASARQGRTLALETTF